MASPTPLPAHVADLPEAGRKGLTLPALPPRLLAGGVLVVAGLISVLIAWGQTRHLENPAAQIPYLASGGLIGVGLMAVGAALLGGAAGGAAATAAPPEEVVARIDQMAENIDWLADTVEQIAAHLNRVAATEAAPVDAAARPRS
jgi:outer membrane murein-binding lipoprotein Lpp